MDQQLEHQHESSTAEAYFRSLLGDVEEGTYPFGLRDVLGDGREATGARRAVDADVVRRLRVQARKFGVSVASLCHVGWAQVVARASGRDDVVFGTVLFGRMQDAEPVVGPCINTLPVRVSVGDVGVGDAVRRMQAQLTALLQHEHASLALAQRCSGLPAQAALFSALLNYRHSAGGMQSLAVEAQHGWIGVEPLRIDERSNYPLSLSVDDVGDGLVLTAQVEAAVGAERICTFMERALETLVEALETAPDRAVTSLDVLPPAERQCLLVDWNQTAADYPREASIHGLFAQQVAQSPASVAVIDGDRRLTYGELNARATRLADELQRLGVGAGDRVAVLLERSIELVVAELGILQAGAAYVPLDPSYPAERLRFMLADSGASVVVSAGRYALPDLAAQMVDLDGLGAGTEVVAVERGPKDLACIMYTSGSTGRPKGVMAPHGAVVQLVRNGGYAAFGPDDRVALAANPAFDATTMEVWGALLNGGTVVVVRQDDLLDAERFRAVLRRDAVTILFLTVGLFNQYADAFGDELRQLRTMLVGGDALDPRRMAQVMRRCPPQRMLNIYGPTETTTYAMSHPIEGVPDEAQPIPLGRPLANTKVYILDGRGRPCPIGVAGEIHIGGDGVALGYLNLPELSGEKFVADPFGGGRMYRTGDLGRWQADGTVDFLGRNDFQVKIRGFRVELGEIETRLSEQLGVRQATVVARGDGAGEKRLVAYYVASEAEHVVNATTLRAALSAALPAHAVPSAFVRMEVLPLTPTGKLDRAALPEPDEDALATAAYEAPQGPIECAIADIVQDMLGIDRVGRHDNFFDLGGHSLLATQLVSRLRRAGAELALRQIFARPVVADLAADIGPLAAVEDPILPARRDAPLAASYAQERLWFLDRLDGRRGVGAAYLVPLALRLRGSLDQAALRQALQRIVDRHETLRTALVEQDGRAVQVIAPSLPIELPVVAVPDEASLQAWIAADRQRGLPLGAPSLFRATLLRLCKADHVLVVAMHHAVSDGWSLGVLMAELNALYAAFVAGAADPLPALPIQYADYAAWQREPGRAALLDEQLAYWKGKLADLPPLLNLPVDRPRLALQSFVGASVPVRLPASLTASLQALSRQHDATLFMVLGAAFLVLLGRHANQTDVAFGSPIANRTRQETEGLIGFFANTLVLRGDLSGAPGFAAFLAQFRETCLEAYGHQDVPFEQLVGALNPERSLSHSPLFQAMFVLQNQPSVPPSLPGLKVSAVEVPSRVAQFDLSLSLEERDGALLGEIEYNSDLFHGPTIERLSRHFRTLLAGIVADPSCAVSALPLLGETERWTVVEAFNATEAAYPSDRLIHELFAAQAAASPDAVALVFEGESLSYGALEAASNRLAHRLRGLGVGPEILVGVCAERSLDMVVGLLAVLKAGGAYVPLDPSYPAERLGFMLEDAQVPVLLTQQHLLERLPATEARVVCLDHDAGDWTHLPATAPQTSTHPDNLAYVIYTSGSTGRPKGAMNNHRAVVNRLWWMQKAYSLGPDDRVLQKTPFSFDVSVWEFFWPLLAGARLVIARPGGHQDPAYLTGLITRERIDTVHFVPSMLQAFLEAPEASGCVSLRRVVCSGEALPYELARRLFAVLPQASLHNLYGPTECAVDVTAWTVPQEEGSGPILIGRPIANTRAYVLDGGLRPVPIGVAGELHLGGIQVGRGYLNRPDLTAERFIANPFVAGDRLYKAGDLARWRADGTLEYLGRLDFQVKLRGFRIELGEIEACLLRHDAVREAVVEAREDRPGDKRLVAYVVSAPGHSLDAAALRAHLGGKLPDYMVPSAFVELTALPLTPSGKLDRRALPKPDMATLPATEYVAPRNGTEEVLASIWAELLGLDRVGIEDNFFDLGGHSLLAVRLIGRILRAFATLLPVSAIFETPTIAGLADRIGPLAAVEDPIVPVRRDAPLAASYAQERLWFLDRLDGRRGVGSAYLVPLALRLRGSLDQAALRLALQRIVDRHETLRTALVEQDGRAVQVIAPSLPIELPVVAVPDEASLEAWIAADRQRSLPLDAPSLFRATLLRRCEAHHVLVVAMHHAVSDGWSLGVLMAELNALYAAFVAGDPDPLPALPIQYADYAVWQREPARTALMEEQLAYWKGKLADLPPLLSLPVDRPRPALQSFVGASIPVRLPASLTASLQALSRQHDATLFMVLGAAFLVLLGRHANQTDVAFGSPIANRTRQETEGLIGFFANTLVLRGDLSGAPGFAAFLAQFRETCLEAYGHQDVPFEQLVGALNPERSLSHSPLFQAMFVLQNQPAVLPSLSGLKASAIEVPSRVAQFDLTLSLEERDGALLGEIEYNSDLFDGATMERLSGHFATLLAGIVADPSCAISALPLLDEAERRTVLQAFNATEAAYPSDRLIHELFAAQAAASPDAVALVFEGESLSYGALEAASNRLAHHLGGLGVGPEILVGVCADRSPDMVVGLLAVLKAGGAYVPLDPSYPAERLGFMLEDAQVQVLLTQQHLLARLPVTDARVVCLDRDAGDWTHLPATAPQTSTHPDNLAYVIYTSGSTGRPKGVMVEHRNLINLIAAIPAWASLPASPTVLSLTAMSFDIFGLELFLPLTSGGRMVIAPDACRYDRELFAAAVSRHKPDLVQTTPASWQMIAASPVAIPIAFCGGEELAPNVARQLTAISHEVVNLYGPTETTIWSTSHRVTDGGASVPIGQPIANTRVYVIDQHGVPVPIGVAGELWIGGAGVARGYLNRAELTAERFVASPFVAGDRLYKTGDLARWHANGALEFLGRVDNQVKIRGIRIEPGEIETCLLTHDTVREAAVVIREDHPGDKRLVAYVVPATPTEHGSDAVNVDAVNFSLFYFGADAEGQADKYRLYLESARFADAHNFEAIWTPERHFHRVGSLYPNPSLLNAALAAITENVKLRAGSVVLPLHNPIRVAEEWSVVDNLSRGRVGVAIASGWHPRDFVFDPHNFENRHRRMREGIETLKSLWAGESISLEDGSGGTSEVRIYPQPVQANLPLWITAAGNPDTFKYAGAIGANVLTHILGQTIDQVAENISLYRRSRAAHGHDPRSGKVTLMVHTFVGDDQELTLERSRAPFINYIRQHVNLMQSAMNDADFVADMSSEAGMQRIAEFAFERYSRTASLIGTPQHCLPFVTRLKEIGVNEIACLIDWMESEQALAGLTSLNELYGLSRTAAVSSQSLQRHCREKLPAYMVPAAFVFLDKLPLTPNGKLDRRALPAPDAAMLPATQHVAPRNGTEEALAGIWAELLGLDRVGIEDNFFDLGGHSLLAVRLIGRIQRAFATLLPVAAIFETPTVAGLAERIGPLAAIKDPIVPVRRDAPLAASYAQERLWFLDRLDGRRGIGSAYLVPLALRLRGSLDQAALRQALQRIVDRHETLRTALVEQDGRAVQVIAPSLPIELPVVAIPDEAAMQAWIAADRQRGLALDAPSLFRATLLRLCKADHVLVVAMHHAVSDGWSLGVLMAELNALYAAFVAGDPDPLPALPIQYADYAVWQREPARTALMDEQLAYWKDKLADLPPLLSLPVDRPRPALQSFVGASIPVRLPASLTASLQALSRQHDATLFMVLGATFLVLLGRHANQTDVAFGSPIANRTRQETEGLIGFFANTLVLRGDLSGAPGFAAFLAQFRETCLEAYGHQDVPFEQLVGALNPERSLSHSPLFQAMFVLQNQPAVLPSLSGLKASAIEVPSRVAQFDLTLSLEERDGALLGEIEYNSDLFDGATMERLSGHFATLLAGIVADPSCAISALPLLDEAERRTVLQAFNATEAAYPSDRLIHELFAAQAAASPDAVALVFEGESLSYGALEAASNRLAHHLGGLGVGPEILVGVCADRSPDMVVGLLAVLKAGGAYVPLDPSYPAERLGFMLEDAQVQVLLTQQHLLQRLPATDARVVCLDRDAGDWTHLPATAPQTSTHPDNLAYVIYTSGSTGRPKGVMLHHRGLCNMVPAYAACFDLDAHSRVLQFASLSFDVATAEIMQALTQGAALVLGQRDALMPGDALHDLLVSQRVTHALLSPTALAATSADDLPDLRTVVTTGEACTPAVVERWAPRKRLVNAYGPTEITVWAAATDLHGGQTIAIGRPLSNTRAYILDGALCPVPIGVAGELHIGGVQVGRGYLNRPELTAERFIANPFVPGDRLYKTGDLARWWPDGTIEYLGRLDFQVKIRGFRIELGEIEACLMRHGDVREAVVVAREDRPGDTRLVAYVVPTPGHSADAAGLRVHLRDLLPDYMVPSAFVELSAMPLNANGKVDRRALPAPDHRNGVGEIAPHSPAEAVLADIVAAVLGLERVGVEDNFFELGGDSILLLQVVARARQAGLYLTARQMFEQQTVAGLAEVAQSAGNVLAPQGSITGPVPLTPIQHWYLAQEPSRPAHFNQSILLQTAPDLVVSALAEALEHLTRHHDALRLRFMRVGDVWQQRHAAQGEGTHVVLTCTMLPADPEALAAATGRAQAELDLGSGPLLRAILFSGGPGKAGRLFLTIHHLAVDGVSWRVLLEDLATLYTQAVAGDPFTLPRKTSAFRDWALWLQQHAASPALAHEAAWWRGLARDAPAMALPIDGPENHADANTAGSVETVRLTLDTKRTQALLHEVPSVYHTQINDVLLTALGLALSEWAGRSRVVVDLEGHGREAPSDILDLSRTVGWFTALFPVALELWDRTPGAALKAVKEQLRAIPGRGLGYGVLRYMGTGIEEAWPSAELCFNYLGQLDQISAAEAALFAPVDEPIGPVTDPGLRRAHRIVVNSAVERGQLLLVWEYSRALHRHGTIADLAERYRQALEALIDHCLEPGAGGFTPSDFPDVELDQGELEELLGTLSVDEYVHSES